MPINAKATATTAAQATLGGKGINEWRARQEAARRAAALSQAQAQLTTGAPGAAMVPAPTQALAPITPGAVQQIGGPFGNAATQAAQATVGGNQQLALSRGVPIAKPFPEGIVGPPPASLPSAASSAAAATADAGAVDVSKYALTADDFATTAGNGLTGWKALLAKTPSPLVEGSAAATPFAAGTVGRGGLYALGGQVAGGIFDRAVGERDGTWDDAAGSALRWGGAGAGIGSMIAPGIGTAIGGAAGLAIGGVKGYLTGQDSEPTQARDYLHSQLDPSNTDGLIAKFDKYGITGDTRNNLLMQIDLIGAQMGTKDEAKALVTQIVSGIPDIVTQQQQTAATQARSAAIQSYLQPMIEQQLANYNQSNQQSANLASSAAGKITDPALADIYRSHAQQMLTAGNSAGLGYLQQMAVAPQLYGQTATDPSLYAGANAQMPQPAGNQSYMDAYYRALGAANGKTAGAPATSGVPAYTP